MITYDEVRQKASRRYPDYLRAWLRQTPFFPLDIPFRKPQPSDGYLALRDGIQALVAGSKEGIGYGYRVEFATRQTRRLGEQSLPQRIVIETEADFARLLDKDAEIAQFQRDAALIRTHLPALETWLLDHPQTVIEHAGEWPDLVQVCRYFLAHPRPHRYLRELPIPIHTKFIEGHKGILRRLLDALLPVAARVIVTRARSVRAADVETLSQRVADRGVAPTTTTDVAEALDIALADQSPIIITGSLFTVADARVAWLKRSGAVLPENDE